MAFSANVPGNKSIELFSVPDNLIQLKLMLSDHSLTGKDFTQVIGKDPALCLRLLKIANNPYYGTQSRVDTISRALSIVSVDMLQSLAVSTQVVHRFEQIPDYLMDMESFWYRSINCAVIAKIIAEKCTVLHPERLFITGLMHDIGSLIIYSQFPAKTITILKQAGFDRYQVIILEQQLLGFTHIDIGVELLRYWNLPASLSESLKHYMHPEAASAYKFDTRILNLATILYDVISGVDQIEKALLKIPAESLFILGIKATEIENIIKLSRKEFSQLKNPVEPNQNSTQ